MWCIRKVTGVCVAFCLQLIYLVVKVQHLLLIFKPDVALKPIVYTRYVLL